MGIIKGIHHVSLKCSNQDEYDKTVCFYKNVLEMAVVRKWDEGIMLDSGNGLIEIFASGPNSHEKGAIRHFALATDDVDACASKVSAAGYEVFLGPKEIEFASKEAPEYKARIAFCKGPLGEEIEFFQVQGDGTGGQSPCVKII